jgi:hypothetical protein
MNKKYPEIPKKKPKTGAGTAEEPRELYQIDNGFLGMPPKLATKK